MNILITGAHGFIGKNLVAWLARTGEHHILGFGRQDPWSTVSAALATADIVFHLAGVNRPQTTEEFQTGNVDFTSRLCDRLRALGRPVPLVFTSSIQATLDNPYGISKRQAEEIALRYGVQSGACVAIYRLPNVFGKWCRPNYNSVVATFAHNIAHATPLTIADPNRELELVYVDDVVQQLLQELDSPLVSESYRTVTPTHQITVGRLAELFYSFRDLRQKLVVPDFGDPFVHKLYATYLAYLATDDFAYPLDKKCDARGCLAEFVKAPGFGQIFVSRTLPGITRGNHYHHTKTEKFLVLQGEACIRFRHLCSHEVIEYSVRGDDFRVVDIPPGYTHAIENTGSGELVTLFWASEVFDATRPDTYALPVLASEGSVQ